MPTDDAEYVYSRDGRGEWTENGGLLPRPAGHTPPATSASSTCSWTLKLSCAALCAMIVGVVVGAAMQARLQSQTLHRPDEASAPTDSAEQALRTAPADSAKQALRTSNLISSTGSTFSTPAATTTDLAPTPASTAVEQSSPVDSTGAGKPPYANHFYMYRVQNDEDYSPENQNMANIGGALWYLHNEIVFHHWNRGGTYASTPKTRIERFEVRTRATPKLYKQGMNFGVVNTYDLGQCTGPFKCENLKEYGPVVGCETWQQGEHLKYNNTFPHQQWVGKNMYPNAIWYSLPGACSSSKFWHQQGQCSKSEPSGACPQGVTPTGKEDCTYSYKKVGEIRISDLEGIKSFNDLVVNGGREYDRDTDAGVNMHFWDHINSTQACQERIDKVNRMFEDKFPYQATLADPICDFDVMKFYPNFPGGDFQRAD
eukprot:TRINITY_DN36626_c0_g1_i1.p1 TRINITY_DN36626_c0_g1~~TRINITY_DN36626_c0_g1_i1.p1  ORF type:complete len:437 (+),score=35.67 TRINITY_DN36626_c0_g1_i1:30-1313(+)